MKQINSNKLFQNLLTDLIKDKALEIFKLQKIIKSNELDYKSTIRKIYTFSRYFKRYI